MKDKVIIGIASGLTGSVVKDTLSLFGREVLKLHLTYIDYASKLIMGKIHDNTLELAVSLIGELIFAILIATVYVHTKHLIKTNFYLLKGIGFSLLIWFLIRSVVTVGHVGQLPNTTAFASLFNVFVAVAFGIALGYTVEKLENKKLPD